MAGSADRAVTLGIGIKTTGEDVLRALADQVATLAKRGGEAAPVYEQLASELTQLGQQAGALQSFKQLAAEVEALTAEQMKAAEAVAQIRGKYDEAAAGATKLREQQAALKQEQREAEAAARAYTAEITTLKDQLKVGAITEAQFAESLTKSREGQIAAKETVAQRRAQLADLNTELNKAEQAESKLERQLDRSTTTSQKAQAALDQQAEAMRKAGASAAELGVNVESVANAEAALLESQQRVANTLTETATREAAAAEQAKILGNAQKDAAAAALKLAQEADASRIAEYVAALDRAGTEADRLAASQKRTADEIAALKQAIATREIDQYVGAVAAAAREVELLEAQERVAAERAREMAAATKQAAEAAQALRAAAANSQIDQYVQALAEAAREADVLEAQEKIAAERARELAAASEQAGAALREAFGQTGVRSLQQIQSEVNRVGSSLALLRSNYEAGAISARDFDRATSSAQVRLAQLRQEALNIPALPGVFESLNSVITGLINKFGALSAAIATVGFGVKPILEANIELENLRRTLTFVTGSAETAGKSIDFLRSTAERNGLAVGQLSDSYSLFVSSLQKSGISLKDTQALFGGVSAAAGQLGISTDRTGNILLALGQVANKGKVAMEELQGQIGEALPGALKIAADSLGVTTAELGELLKSGKLMADDFLPAFARQLNKTFGDGQAPVKGLGQAINDVKTAATVAAQQLADTSGYKALTGAVEGLAKNFDSFLSIMGSATKAFLAFKAIDMTREFLGIKAALESTTASKIKDVAATEATVVAERTATAAREASVAAVAAESTALAANTAAKAANSAATTFFGGTVSGIATGFDKAATAASGLFGRVGSLVGALGGPYGAALTATIAFSDQLGKGLAYVAAKMTGVIDLTKQNEKAIQASAEAERKAVETARQAADAREQSIARQTIDIVRLQKAAESNVLVAEREVKAVKERGVASVEAARLVGDEAKALTASANAAGANELASRQLLAAKQQVLDATQKEIDAIIRAAGGEEKLSAQRKQQVAELRLKINETKAAVDVARSEVEANAQTADSAFKAAQAYGDLSGQLNDLKGSAAATREVIAGLQAQQREGLPVAEALANAQRTLNVTLGLQRKAIDDARAAAERKVQIDAAESAGVRAKLQVTLESQRASERLALLNNDEATAAQARIRQREIEVQQLVESNRQKSAAADIEKKAAESEIEELQRLGQLTPVKRDELLVRIKNAEAKKSEAAAGADVVRSMEYEIQAAQRLAAAKRLAQDAGKVGNFGDTIQTDANGRSAYQQNLMAQQGGPVDASYVFDLFARYQSGSLTSADLAGAQNALKVARDNARLGANGSVSIEGRQNDALWVNRLQQIVDALGSGGLGGNRIGGGGGLGGGLAPQPSAGGSSSTSSPTVSSAGASRTININLGGTTTPVTVASEEDAAQLEALLKRLASASGRSV